MIEVREVATGEMLTDLDVDFPRVSGINVTSTGIQLIGQLDSETGSMELAWFDLSGTQIWRVDLAAIVPIDQYANAVDDEYLAMPLRWFALDDDRAVRRSRRGRRHSEHGGGARSRHGRPALVLRSQ